MADYYWPDEGLTPFQVTFFLQSHTGRMQNPLTRHQKIYALSAPLWVARLSIRGGYSGSSGLTGIGAAMDALLARLKGGQNRVGFWDFRRPAMRGLTLTTAGNLAGVIGDTTLTLTGLVPGQTVLAGDYIGGEGRPHIITEDVTVAGGGTAVVGFEPPLTADLALNGAVFGNPRGWFRLVSDDAGANGVEVGNAVTYDLEFIEDWLFAPASEPEGTLRIGGILILIGGEEVII